jgi:hypothetical protein
MSDIYHFTARLSINQQSIMHAIDNEIIALPGMVMKERYKLPFYYGRSWICYLNPVKNDAVELAFTRGNELSNAHRILDFRDRKQIAGIVCTELAALPWPAIRDTLFEAIALDRDKPYRLPRRANRHSK